MGIAGLIAGQTTTQAGLLTVGVIMVKDYWFVLLFPLAGLGKLATGRHA